MVSSLVVKWVGWWASFETGLGTCSSSSVSLVACLPPAGVVVASPRPLTFMHAEPMPILHGALLLTVFGFGQGQIFRPRLYCTIHFHHEKQSKILSPDKPVNRPTRGFAVIQNHLPATSAAEDCRFCSAPHVQATTWASVPCPLIGFYFSARD